MVSQALRRLWGRRWGRACRQAGSAACRRAERGATTAEYAMVLALVVVVLLGILTQLGDVLQARLEDIVGKLNGAGGSTP